MVLVGGLCLFRVSLRKEDIVITNLNHSTSPMIKLCAPRNLTHGFRLQQRGWTISKPTNGNNE